MTAPYIVAVGGTLRSGSSTEHALRHALAAAQRAGARTRLICGSSLDLPAYQPENPNRTAAALELIQELRAADGIILGSPGYHGGISGIVKNALDYTEDMRGDTRSYFSGRAVGCIATAGGWSGAVNTLGALRDVVHALRGWPTPMGVALNTSEKVFDATGVCVSARAVEMLDTLVDEVLSFARYATLRPSGSTGAD